MAFAKTIELQLFGPRDGPAAILPPFLHFIVSYGLAFLLKCSTAIALDCFGLFPNTSADFCHSAANELRLAGRPSRMVVEDDFPGRGTPGSRGVAE